MFKRTKLALAMALSTALLFTACSGTSPAGNSATESSTTSEADAERSAAEEEARKAEEEAKAAEEAAKKEEEERLAAEAALQAELEEYGIESVEGGVLAEIAEACEKEDYESAWELMFSEAYDAEAHELDESGEDRRVVETPFGIIGMYHMETYAGIFAGDYLVYYGDFVGNQREGDGIWLGIDYFENQENKEWTCIAKGDWTGDMPNGKQEYVTYHAGTSHTTTGNVINGFWDGEVIGLYFDESVLQVNEGAIDTSGLESGVAIYQDGTEVFGYFLGDNMTHLSAESIEQRRHGIIGYNKR